nr:universal stress protein [uncultured Celeribacter sp.]
MFKTILVPVDLAHKDRLSKALDTAAKLAECYDSALHIVGVTTESPSAVAHTPDEYKDKLTAYATYLSKEMGREVSAHAIAAHDLTIDLNRVLMDASQKVGADLVVMASHIPGFAEYLFNSNAGYLASHSKISVFVVR